MAGAPSGLDGGHQRASHVAHQPKWRPPAGTRAHKKPGFAPTISSASGSVQPGVKQDGSFTSDEHTLTPMLAALHLLLMTCCPLMALLLPDTANADDCKVTRVIHVLQFPGCAPKPIPSFACIGKCTSYVQVSGSKIWQTERSCMCCQESGEREATVSLYCPNAEEGEPKFRKVVTRAPVDCMCRPCTAVEESAVLPQEIAGFANDGPVPFTFT